MSTYKYYIGCEDYFGNDNRPNEIFNNQIVPYIESCGLNEDQIKEVKNMVSEIAEAAYSNGADNERCSIDD